jgi:hypothetical protein
MLESGAEETLVRVECAVEILDRETDVVHRAGCIHRPIVCERFAAGMRPSALALVLGVLLLAGCGGHSKSATSNGEASKSADRVLADAKAAADGASSTRVSGNIVSGGTPITLDLSMTNSKAKGSMSTSGFEFDLIRIGDTAYIKGSDDFYKHFAGAGIAQLLHGKWLKASIVSGRFASLAPLTSISLLFDKVASNHGKLANDGTKTFKGQKVVEIRDMSDNSKLYVAATGKPYPVAIVGGKKGQSGTITFDDWNKSLSVSAPKGAIDISQLGG